MLLGMSAIDRLRAALAGRYSIEVELGTGGMATVWLAHDLRHNRRVALKVLHPHVAAVLGADRFLKEIQTTANLQHPHILPLFDSGDADGLLFYVMPYVDGVSLRERITREKQLQMADVVRITSEVASALDYAHRRGVIHRDIKPENILLHDGRAMVCDFGIALAPGSATNRLTEAGMLIGTPEYMSPEQASGERHLDARSDIYAVGVLLYEMLTGAPPFTGPSARAIVAKVFTEKPVPPSRVRKDVLPHVEHAVLTALQKDPANRFATGAALQVAIEGRSALQTKRGSNRRRATWVAIVGVCALVLGGLAVRPWRDRHQIPVRAAPDTAAKRLVVEAAEWATRRNPKGCEMAITLFSQATDKDTAYARAWGGLAKTHALCALFGGGDPAVAYAAAKSASETALHLDSTVSDAYTARGMVHVFHDQDYARAQVAFRKAILLDSTRYEPWLFQSLSYLAMDKMDSAVSSIRRAKELQIVGDLNVRVRLADILHDAGRIKESDSVLADVLMRDSTNRLAHAVRFQWGAETGNCDRDNHDLRWLEHDFQQITLGVVGYHWATCGEPGRARAYADSVEARVAIGTYVDFFALAMVYAGLGDSPKMFETLDRAVKQHNWALFGLAHTPAFLPYRGTREFADLMKKAHVK